jgi:hypothetical protein
MLTPADSVAPWVDETTGLVSRKIFVNEDIYRLELERIFGRVWLYVAHETEIPNSGDFVTSACAVCRSEADGCFSTIGPWRDRTATPSQHVL